MLTFHTAPLLWTPPRPLHPPLTLGAPRLSDNNHRLSLAPARRSRHNADLDPFLSLNLSPQRSAPHRLRVSSRRRGSEHLPRDDRPYAEPRPGRWSGGLELGRCGLLDLLCDCGKSRRARWPQRRPGAGASNEAVVAELGAYGGWTVMCEPAVLRLRGKLTPWSRTRDFWQGVPWRGGHGYGIYDFDDAFWDIS